MTSFGAFGAGRGIVRLAVELLVRQADAADEDLVGRGPRLAGGSKPIAASKVTSSSWSTPSPLTPRPPTSVRLPRR